MKTYSGTYETIIDAAADAIAASRGAGDLGSWLAAPVEVLVPSAAVASSLTRAIVARRGATAGVQIETIDRLAPRIVTLAHVNRRVASGEERSLAMQLALRAAAPDDPIFTTPGITTLLERSWRDAADSGTTLKELRTRAQRHRDSHRFASTLAIWTEYEGLLERIASVDPATRLHDAIAALASVNIAPQILVGFYDVTQLQERFLRALKGAGKLAAVYFPFTFEGDEPAPRYSFASRLVRRLLDGEQPEEVAPRRAAARVEVIRRTTRAEEHSAVCRSIAQLLSGGTPASDVGVVKRSLTPLDVDLLQRTAREFGFAFNRGVQRPLVATRPGRALRLLLSVAKNGFGRQDVIEIAAAGLRTPLLRSDRAVERLDDISRRCDIVGGTATEVQRVVAASLYAEDNRATDYINFVRELESITRKIPDAATGAVWRSRLASLLDQLKFETESDLAAASVIDELIASISRFPATVMREDVIALLRDSVVEAEVNTDAVWVGDVMHARGRTFAHLYLIAAEDDQFPQRRSEDPLLPDSVRDHFSVRQIGTGEEEEQMLFELLRDAARERFVASMAATEAGGKLKRPSRFVLQACREIYPDETGAIVSNFAAWADAKFPIASAAATRREQRRRALIERATPPSVALQQALRRAATVRTRSSYDGFIGSAEFRQTMLERLGRISPTRLERFGDCPQKFLFSSLLNVDELETPEGDIEMEPKKRGQLQHRILEQFYRSLDESDYARADTSPFARLDRALASRLREITDAELGRFDDEHPPLNATVRELDHAALRTSLARFVGLDLADLARSGYRPAEFEFSFGDEEGRVPAASLQLGDVTLTVRGTIDRVDRKPDSAAVRILDYKSNRASHLRGIAELAAAGRALQLPLYALAWEQIFSLAPELITGVIRPLGALTLDDETFSFNLGELRTPLIETLELFAHSIVEGRFPAVPENGCRFCALNLTCRVKHDPDERLQLRGFKSAREYLLSLGER